MKPATPAHNTLAPTPAIVALVTLLALLWGGNSVFIKVGLRAMPPFALTALRLALGLAVVGAWAVLRRIPLRLQPGEFLPHAALAGLFLLQVLALHAGTHFTLAAHSTVMMSTYPLFTSLFAHLLIAGDRLTPRTVAGLALGFAGVLATFAPELIAGGGPASAPASAVASAAGSATVLASAALLGLRTAVSKRMLHTVSAEKLLFWMLLLSLPAAAALSLLAGDTARLRFDAGGLLAIGYVGVVIAGFCFLAWTAVLARYRASRLTVMFFATPLSGTFLSWWITGDPLGPSLLLGAVLVAAGIFVNARAHR